MSSFSALRWALEKNFDPALLWNTKIFPPRLEGNKLTWEDVTERLVEENEPMSATLAQKIGQ